MKKKSIFKRWWFYVALVAAIIVVAFVALLISVYVPYKEYVGDPSAKSDAALQAAIKESMDIFNAQDFMIDGYKVDGTLHMVWFSTPILYLENETEYSMLEREMLSITPMIESVFAHTAPEWTVHVVVPFEHYDAQYGYCSGSVMNGEFTFGHNISEEVFFD